MRCGVVLVTHPGLGSALLDVVRHLLGPGPLPLDCRCLEVGYGQDPGDLVAPYLALLQGMDAAGGIVLLTDLYGASPSNLASFLQDQLRHCRRVAGLSLPMLLRVMNYSHLELDALTDVAASVPRHGVIVDNA